MSDSFIFIAGFGPECMWFSMSCCCKKGKPAICLKASMDKQTNAIKKIQREVTAFHYLARNSKHEFIHFFSLWLYNR